MKQLLVVLLALFLASSSFASESDYGVYADQSGQKAAPEASKPAASEHKHKIHKKRHRHKHSSESDGY